MYFKNAKPKSDTTKAPIYLHVRTTQGSYVCKVSLIQFPWGSELQYQFIVTPQRCPQYRAPSILSPDWSTVHVLGDIPMGEPCWISWIYTFFYSHYLSGLGMEKDADSKNRADSLNAGTDTGSPHQPGNTAASPKSPLGQFFTYFSVKIPYKQIPFTPAEVTWSYTLRHFDSNWLKLISLKINSLETILSRRKKPKPNTLGKKHCYIWDDVLRDFHLAGGMEKGEEVLYKNQTLICFLFTV